MRNLVLKLVSCLCCLFVSTVLLAQTQAVISGVVLDQATKEPIIGATIIAEGTNAGAITDETGSFTLEKLKVGSTYTIEFSFVGYTPEVMEIKLTTRNYKLDSPIKLKGDGLIVEETMVQGEAPVAKLLGGDTVQFNAGAYKTNPDATAEDLLAKMPGFTIDGSSITAQGEEITQIYVDGKPYFKDNPMAALSALPADAIESIQQFDEKSDQSKMTGFDDGDTQKTLNIITKAKRKQDYFGDFIGGYGTDGRYNAKGNLNIFSGDHRFTLGFGFNNINQSSVEGGSRFYGNRGVSGIQRANGVKLNYSGDFKKSEDRYLKLGVNYMFTNTQTETNTILTQDYFADASAGYDDRLYASDTKNNYRGSRHSFKFDVETSFNENNKLYFRPYAYFGNGASNVYTTSTNVLDDVLTNTADTWAADNYSNYGAGGNLTWMHKYNSKRTTTFELYAKMYNSSTNTYLVGTTQSLNELVLTDSLINQFAEKFSNSNTISGKINYTEKLSKSSGLIFNYKFSYNWSTSDNKTYLYDYTTGLYSDIDDALSNEFNRDYITNSGGVGYSLNKSKKLSFNVGVDYQNANLQNRQVYPSSTTRNYSFNSVLANMKFDYNFTDSKKFIARFNGSPDLPSITQLQDVVDNSNPLQISTGNPYLDQAYYMRMMFMYFNMNTEKSTSLRIFTFARSYTNTIASNTRFLSADEYVNGVYVQNGAQVSTYANAGLSWNSHSGIDYTFPLKFMKSNFTTVATYNFDQSPSLYNDESVYSYNHTLGLRLNITSNISENFDYTLYSNASYSMASSTLSSASNNDYLYESAGIRLNWIFLKSFVFNTDYSYNYYYYSDNAPDDPNYHMLNMGFGRKFLKNKAELRISAYDLLDQNKGNTHTVGSLYVQDSNTNVLSRYFMLSFSYKFNTMSGGAKSMTHNGESSSRGPGGPGGPPR